MEEGTKKMLKKVAVGALAVGGAILVYRLLTKNQRDCKKSGGTWDKATKTCKLPEVVKKAYDNLTFQSGKAIINPSSLPSLKELSDYLVANPTFNISIEGHTDNQGSDAINQKLSEARAKAVKLVLTKNGVAETRINAVGFGSTKPIADNTTAEGREKNRRVEFIIS